MNKRVLVALAVVVTTAVVFALMRQSAVPVQTASVQTDTLSVTIPAEGITRARERYTVTAPVAGRLARLDLQEGDSVHAGQVIGQIYPSPQDPRVVAVLRAEADAAEARHRQAESGLREAGLQAEQATREVERRRPLAAMGAIAPERLEQAELTATVAEQRRAAAEADVESARANLESARARLLGATSVGDSSDPFQVRAPVAGRVLQIPDESERIVSAGAPLLTLADIGGLEVVMDVLSEDAVEIDVGDAIVLTDWGGPHALYGQVRRVTLVGYTKVSTLGVEEQRVDVIADLHEPPTSLGSGYRVSGEIVVSRGSDVLTVPTSALFRQQDAWHAFVVTDGRAHVREVTLGRRNDVAGEVLTGLEAGDVVILFPPEAVGDDVRVRGETR